MAILYFALMIGVLVFVHELGHYLAARWCGVHARQFAIGVGPRVASITRDGTEFRIGLLPLGGYVMMAESRDEAAAGRLALPEAAIWKRAVIAVAGPVFSLLFPVLCYLAVGLGSATMPAAVPAAVAEDGPAAEAGMLAGDEIVAIDGQDIHYWHELEDAIADSSGAIDVDVLRDGQPHTLSMTPSREAADGRPRIGVLLIAPPPDAEEGAEPIGPLVERDFPLAERLPWAVGYALTEPFVVSERVLTSLGGFATGSTSTKELGGPLMIFDVSQRAGEQGWRTFLIVMAVISVNLALINMLPIPILDGGRLVLLAVEAVQRKPLSARTQQITAMVGMAMVVGLMLLAFKNDIERYWSSWM